MCAARFRSEHSISLKMIQNVANFKWCHRNTYTCSNNSQTIVMSSDGAVMEVWYNNLNDKQIAHISISFSNSTRLIGVMQMTYKFIIIVILCAVTHFMQLYLAQPFAHLTSSEINVWNTFYIVRYWVSWMQIQMTKFRL